MSKKAPVTLVTLGLADAGKTTFHYCLKFGEICTTEPTHGFNFLNHKYKKHKLELYDYGGSKLVQERIWDEAISKANGIFWVVDANDPNTLNESVETLRSVVLKFPSSNHISLCILANKTDLASAMDPSQVASAFSSFSNAKVFNISALDHQTLDAPLAWILNDIKSKEKANKKEKKDKEKKEKKKDKSASVVLKPNLDSDIQDAPTIGGLKPTD